jgi:UDP-N-acetylglucosamine transferase subunit ALG13
MIFVTVGTNEARFDRLLQALDGVSDRERLLVQHGPSPVRPAGAESVDYLSYADLCDAIRQSRVVVTHAGVGSIMAALSNGRRPIVVPRLARFGEAVDDHQVPLARRLAESGLVTVVEELNWLAEAIDSEPESEPVRVGVDPQLIAELGAFLRAPTARRRRLPGRPEPGSYSR